jgi:hypothetical protein
MRGFDRRTVVAALAAGAAWPGAAVGAGDPLDALVRRAFLFAFPVQTMLRTRAAALARAGNLNRLNHRRTLSGAADRNVTTPNNDTLYSAAWLDLAGGPLILTMPAAPARYHSAALLDLFTDNDAVLGTRSDGGRGGRFAIAGPDWRGEAPAGTTLVRARTNDAWMIVRVLVAGPEDLSAAQEVQSGFTLEPMDSSAAPRPFTAAVAEPGDPAGMLAMANEALARGSIPAAARARLAGLARVGLEPGRLDAWSRLPDAVRAAWTRQAPALLVDLRRGLQATGVERGGWSYPRPGMGDYGDDDLYRSRVALGGLGALPLTEATYLTARTDATGAVFDGSRAYELRVPPRVPVRAFWSLGMYEIAADGRLFFTANPIDRYALGDRSPGLRREPDGSVVIRMQPQRPATAESNWLPTPAGPFVLTFRGYLPDRSLLGRTFLLPQVRPLR